MSATATETNTSAHISAYSTMSFPSIDTSSISRSTVLARKGPIILRHMLPRDYPAYDRINDAAFATSLTSLFYPKGKSEADKTWSQRIHHAHLTRDAHYMKHLVSIDTSAPPLPSDLRSLGPSDRSAAQSEGRVVGFSVWKVRPRDRTTAELAEEAAISDADGYPPSGNKELFDDFAGQIAACKKKYVGGKKHILLHLLATDPDYHRRGIGAMHMAWGLEEADRLGVMGYLEGSVEGRGLYERWGFEAVERLDFDARKYGAKEEMVYMIMIRPAKQA